MLGQFEFGNFLPAWRRGVLLRVAGVKADGLMRLRGNLTAGILQYQRHSHQNEKSYNLRRDLYLESWRSNAIRFGNYFWKIALKQLRDATQYTPERCTPRSSK